MKKYLWGLISLPVAAALVYLDQITKIWAVSELEGKGTIQVLGDFFIYHFARNRGAFLSLGNNLPDFVWYFGMVILPVAALLGFTIYVVMKHPENLKLWVLWILVTAGGAGNLVDRILSGAVVDFMNLGIGPIRSGIFNVADLYIVFAVIFVLFWSPFKKTPKK